jgi:hypothetical protein
MDIINTLQPFDAVQAEHGYKIVYFRIVDQRLLADRPTDSRAEPGLVLEIGLMPNGVEVTEVGADGNAAANTGCFQIPAGSLKTIRMQAGNTWPFGVPLSHSVELGNLPRP